MFTNSYRLALPSAFALAAHGHPDSSTTITFPINRVGKLTVLSTGVKTPVDKDGNPLEPPPPMKPGDGNGDGGGGGGTGTGHPPQREHLDLTWTLLDPNGAAIPTAKGPAQVPFAVITLEKLDQVRDAAGFCRRPWTLTVTNPSTKVALSLVLVGVWVEETVASSSAPPLLDWSVQLEPGQPQVFPLNLNRLGTLRAKAQLPGAGTVHLELIRPSGTVSTQGNNALQGSFGQKDLYDAAREAPDRYWSVRATLGGNGGPPVACGLNVQVTDTLHLPASVLQTRFDGVFGSGNNIAISAQFDNATQANIVYLTINSDDVFYTFDTLEILNRLEKAYQARFNSTTLRPLGTPANLEIKPRVPYPVVFDLTSQIDSSWVGTHAVQLRDFQTSSITVTISTGEILAAVKLAGTAVVDIEDLVTVELKNVALQIYIALETGADRRIACSAQATIAFDSNIVNLPDDLYPGLDGRIRATLEEAVKQLGAKLADPLEQAFYILMGGLFDLVSHTFKNNEFLFDYVPGEEPKPGRLSPSYLPFGKPALAAPKFTSPNLKKIDHIVVLSMENRSFDHVLGYLSLNGNRGEIDGLTPQIVNSFPQAGRPQPLPDTHHFPFDPDHDFEAVAIQMGPGPGGQGSMGGFGQAFLNKYPFLAFDESDPRRKAADPDGRFNGYRWNEVMKYHPGANLPFYAQLAEQYAVCDRWFCSHPGPTFPNRYFLMSGQLNRDRFGEPHLNNDQSSLAMSHDRTIFDALTERGVSWTYFESPPDVTMLRAFARYTFDNTNIRPIDEFYTAAAAGTLPSVTYVDPNFHYGITNDDHPPTDMAAGQVLVQRIYNALTSSAAWPRTLLIVTYDEHGGIYDHVLPDIAEILQRGAEAPISNRFGVRVPAFVISAWIPPRAHSRTVFDHCSILKAIISRFCAADPPILSDRVAWANDIGELLTLTKARRLLQGHGGGGDLSGGELKSDSPVPKAASPTMSGQRLAASKPPLPRATTLLERGADWHNYMAHLAHLVRP